MDRDAQYIGDMLESNTKFRSQFDPNSEDYHGGDQRPVPIGGHRVPDSMPEEFPSQPTHEVIPDDPQYQLTLNARQTLQEFKKVASQVLPSIEAKVRAHQLKDQEKRDTALAEGNNRLNTVLEEFAAYKERLAAFGSVLENYDGQIDQVIAGARVEYETKESYGEYMLQTNIFLKKIFHDIQALLQRIKEIKKAAAAKVQ
ncbi:unnamed protein product [Blepharisma stoltei]|uniref:Uncharacterized protein n=1 Tax=Blepharisma stoltei TaxID=1481888 RepID=A0AAU9JY85_9CILI|nr:unnamed protein product [Blepharisma stoltei]